MSGVDDQKIINDQTTKQTKTDRDEQRAVEDFGRAKAKEKRHIMRVRVYSPFRDYYNGDAFSLSAENATGPFDVLPKHHNFISLLSPCEMVIRTPGRGEQKIIISGGLMHVKANQVVIFLDV